MAAEDSLGHASPSWFTTPGETDILAWVALGFICLALYGIVTLYAAFDRWAEHRSKGTPLARTIPTLLLIALIYEIFPLEHFHIFLPLTAVLLAVMADWSRFHLPAIGEAAAPETGSPLREPSPPAEDIAAVGPAETEEAKHV